MIAPYLLDWTQLLLRWTHVVLAMAWIGASFYFIWLENRRGASDPALAGEPWAKWQAYWTWMTGFALLVAMYYANAELYLIDPAVMPLSKWAAIAISLGFLIVSYSIYEGLCRAPLNDVALPVVLLALFAPAAWGLMQVFSARGAFIHYGAMLGTIMVANVAHIIVPGKDAAMARQRSVHNTCFAVPAVFAMISGHYPMTWHWLALVALTLAGALVRLWFVMRQKGGARWWVPLLGIALVAATALGLKPKSDDAAPPVAFDAVKRVIDRHCVSCHGPVEPAKGVKLDTPERIEAQRAQIRRTALSRAMPPGNLTGMSEEERLLLDRWARMK